MRRRTGVLAGIAVLAAISFWAWPWGEKSRPPARAVSSGADNTTREELELEAAVEAEAGEAGAESAEALDESAATFPAEEDSDGVRSVRITGVVFEDRVPASGAQVMAYRGEDRDRREQAALRMVTGADGRFSFELRTAHAVRLEASKGDRLRGATLFYPRELGGKELRIDLKRAVHLAVRVLDRRDRSPIENARVTCALDFRERTDFQEVDPRARWAEREFGPITTDGEGRATLVLVRPGEYEIEAEHDELGVTVVQQLVALDTDPPELMLELSGASKIFGRVVDEDRQPLAKISLILSPKDNALQFGYRRAVSDQDGRYQVHGVEAGKYRLGPESERYTDPGIDIEKKDNNNDLEVELVLKKGLPVSGQVVDTLGSPIAGISLFLGPEAGGTGRNGKSKRDGSFLFEHVSPGSHVLLAVRPGRSGLSDFFQSDADRITVKAGDRDVVLRVRRAAALRVELDVRGAPPPESYHISFQELEREQPASEPKLLIDNLSPGKVRVLVRAKGFAPQLEEVTLTEGATVTASFTLVAEKTLRGEVIDAVSKAPLGSAKVQALAIDRKSPTARAFDAVETATTEEDGTFILRGLPEEKMSLLVRASAHAATLAGPFEVRADAEPVVIALAPGLKVSGRVHSGAVAPEWSTLILRTADRSPTFAMTNADRHGIFEFDDASSGPQKMTIQAELGGVSRSKNIDLDVPAAGLTGLDIDFATGGARLIIRIPPGPEHGWFLTLTHSGGNQTAIARPDQEVIFDHLIAGDYELESRDPSSSGEPRSMKVTIAEGENETRITLPAR